MASQILLNRSAFEAKKAELQGAVDILRTNSSTLDELRNNTVNAWEGEARDKYNNDMTAGLAKINELIQVLQQFVSTMEEVLNAYENAETQNVGLV